MKGEEGRERWLRLIFAFGGEEVGEEAGDDDED